MGVLYGHREAYRRYRPGRDQDGMGDSEGGFLGIEQYRAVRRRGGPFATTKLSSRATTAKQDGKNGH